MFLPCLSNLRAGPMWVECYSYGLVENKGSIFILASCNKGSIFNKTITIKKINSLLFTYRDSLSYLG